MPGVAVDGAVQREASLLATHLGIAHPMAQLWRLVLVTFAILGLESLAEDVALVPQADPAVVAARCGVCAPLSHAGPYHRD